MFKPEPILFLDDHRGVYIPRDFALCVERKYVTGVSDEDYAILEAGPGQGLADAEGYWETWDAVCRDAVIVDDKGIKYSLNQDGALWLIPDGMEWDEATESYVWPDDPEFSQNGAPA